MNLLSDRIIDFGKMVNKELDDVEFHLPPEPTETNYKNYQTKHGYKAIVQDFSSFDLILKFKNGQIADMQEVPF